MKKIYLLLISLVTLSSLVLLHGTSQAACTAAATNLGTATTTQTVTTTGTYRVWTRLMAPDSTNNSLFLEIDGGTCYVVGDSASVVPNTWTWINYQNGNTGSFIDVTLGAGQHSLKIIGKEPGVKIDRLILTADLNCTPANTRDSAGSVGTNCASPPDVTPPVVTLTAPPRNSTLAGTVSLTASASDDLGGSGLAKVDFYSGTSLLGSDSTASNGDYSVSVDTKTLTNGLQTFSAKAYDVANNSATNGFQVTVQNGTVDVVVPSTPNGLSVVANAYNKVTFSWAASTDNVGVVGYYVYRGSVLVANQKSGTSYVDNTVSANTAYSYRVAAYDAAGNTSAYSNYVSVTTPKLPDTQAPTVPALTGQLVGAAQINLSWTASTDNIGVKEYDVYRIIGSSSATKIATTPTLSLGDSSLDESTKYQYYIVARDANGNSSAPSTSLTFTTPARLAPDATGLVIGRILSTAHTPISGASASLKVNNSTYTYKTGPNGYYVTAGLPYGTYGINFSAPNYTSKGRQVMVSNDATTIRSIFLVEQR